MDSPRRGEVHVEAIGGKALGGSDPIRRDTIFRITSMTKPIAAAAATVWRSMLRCFGRCHAPETLAAWAWS